MNEETLHDYTERYVMITLESFEDVKTVLQITNETKIFAIYPDSDKIEIIAKIPEGYWDYYKKYGLLGMKGKE